MSVRRPGVGEGSRAEVIRRVIDRALAGADDDLAADLAALDSSFGASPSLSAPDRASRTWAVTGDRPARAWAVAP